MSKNHSHTIITSLITLTGVIISGLIALGALMAAIYLSAAIMIVLGIASTYLYFKTKIDNLKNKKRLELESKANTKAKHKESRSFNSDYFLDVTALLDTSKTMSSEHKFFRPSGPTEIDFHEGCIVFRDEVDNVFASLSTKKVALVVGSQGSGKSVLLRTIAYRLLEVNNSITSLELKHFIQLEGSMQNEYKKIELDLQNLKGILIIDDAHLNLDLVEHILKNRKRELSIIIASRPIPLPLFSSRYKYFQSIEQSFIKASNIAPKIVTHFLEKIGESKASPEYVKIFEIYYHDLWNLAISLLTYERHGFVDENVINEYISVRIQKDYELNYGLKNTGDILLPLSVFFSREIPIYKNFLIDALKCKSCDIETLIKANEIVEVNNMLSLHHSSMSRIYLNCFKQKKALGWNTKTILSNLKKNWEKSLFHLYIRSNPPNYVEVFRKIRFEPDLVESILYDDITSKEVFSQLNSEKNLGVVFGLYQDLSWTKKDIVISRFLEYMGKERLISILNDEKVNLDMIAFSLIAIPWRQKNNISNWLKEIAKSREKLSLFKNDSDTNTYSLETIPCPYAIKWDGCEPLDAIVIKVSEYQMALPENVRFEYNKQMIKQVIFCNWNIYSQEIKLCLKAPFLLDNYPVSIHDVIQGLDIKLICSRINKEKDTYILSFFLRTISWANMKYAKKVFQETEQTIISRLIEIKERSEALVMVWSISTIEGICINKYIEYLDKDIKKNIYASGWI